MVNTSVVLFFFILTTSLIEAVEILERKVKDPDGNAYNVTEIVDGSTDIVIMKKDGASVEQQIIRQDKDYVVVKNNGTCNIEFYDEEDNEEKECYKGTVPDLENVSDEIKKECGDLQIVYVRPSECQKEGDIQKRWSCRYYRCCYWRVYCSCWSRRRCSLRPVCYYRCMW